MLGNVCHQLRVCTWVTEFVSQIVCITISATYFRFYPFFSIIKLFICVLNYCLINEIELKVNKAYGPVQNPGFWWSYLIFQIHIVYKWPMSNLRHNSFLCFYNISVSHTLYERDFCCFGLPWLLKGGFLPIFFLEKQSTVEIMTSSLLRE